MRILLLLLALLLNTIAFAQETIVRGRVTDATTNEPIPFANVRFIGTTSGTSCDFDGFYTLRSLKTADSITATYLGYVARTKKVKIGITQSVDFQLQSEAVGLSTVVVVAGENPALRIIRRAVANKDSFNYARLISYEAESYVKILVDVDHISDKFKKRKILKPIAALMDSLEKSAGEDGEIHLPVFYSENLSQLYYTRSPKQKREDIKAARINAVGVKKGSTISQLTGSSFEEYNFNEDKVLLFGKDFLSPIANSAQLFYEFYLLDSTVISGNKCYQIKVKPKNDQDLLFTGTIWITDTSFALKQINLDVPKTANLNFVEKLQIQQELVPTAAGAWFPVKTRSVIDFRDLSNKMVGLIGKFYISYRNVEVNKPKDAQFYQQQLVVSEDALRKDNDFWLQNRHEKLTSSDAYMYSMLDTVKNLPSIRSLVDIAYTLSNGYFDVGPVDLGPYYTTYRFNNIEGNKFRLGFRTNELFSNKWILRGYLGYGTKDQKFKYNAQVERIVSRRKWTKVGIQRRDDIDQVGFAYNYDDSPAFESRQSSLYNTSSQISRFSLLNRKQENRMWVQSELRKGIMVRFAVHNTSYKHFFDVSFDANNSNVLQKDFTTTEIVTDFRFAPNEYYVQNDNRRMRLGRTKAPITTLTYTRGIKKVLNSDFNYSKVGLSINHRIRMGFLGYSQYYVDAGKVLSSIPYTLLEVHRGNQTVFLAGGTFNLMNYFEFVSDEYVSIDYQHHFNGLLFNRIPLIRKLKLREVISANAVYGGLSRKNAAFNDTRLFNTLSDKPYLEATAGIENIFSLFRVDFLWRLSYTNPTYRNEYRQLQLNQGITRPYDINRFGIKVSLNFAF